ncbi:MAG: hypothetical protein JW900_01810 [Anaerolineae bacterium]|nr:hypothetical protein [Anaerolineae bacterium]
MAEAQQDYRSRLFQILTRHFPTKESLKTLFFHLGVEYDTLGGEGTEGKVRELIGYLDRVGRIDDLVQIGKQQQPQAPWDEAAPPARKPPRKMYYVASALDEREIDAWFVVPDETFERTMRFEEAYLVVLDLSHPPHDWIKYVGGDRPLLPMIVFVALKNFATLDGESIIDVIRNCYGFEASVCRRPQDLLGALRTACYVKEVAREARRMAIAGEKGAW